MIDYNELAKKYFEDFPHSYADNREQMEEDIVKSFSDGFLAGYDSSYNEYWDIYSVTKKAIIKRCKSLEKENELLRNTHTYSEQILSCNISNQSLKTSLKTQKEINKELVDENEDLKKLLNKLKCCENCRHSVFSDYYKMSCYCPEDPKENVDFKFCCEKWEAEK